MLTILIGIASSIAAEIITWINSKLSGTVLKGDGALVFAVVIAFIGAVVKIYLVPNSSFHEVLTSASEIWAVSQIFFFGVIRLLGLDIKDTSVTPAGV